MVVAHNYTRLHSSVMMVAKDTTGYRIFWLQFWSKDEQSKKTKIIIRTKDTVEPPRIEPFSAENHAILD